MFSVTACFRISCFAQTSSLVSAFLLIAVFISNIALIQHAFMYRVLMLLQISLYGLAT